MTPQEIIENNILLAEFMGYKKGRGTNYERVTFIIPNLGGVYPASKLKFHGDWNQLMAVVEKIENLHECSDVLLFPAGCSISYNEGAGKVFTCSYDRDTKIEAVYEACTDFVKWYNQQGEN